MAVRPLWVSTGFFFGWAPPNLSFDNLVWMDWVVGLDGWGRHTETLGSGEHSPNGSD